MSDLNYLSLQSNIDSIVEHYVQSHPSLVALARRRDAALHDLSDEDTAEQLKVYPGVVALAVHDYAYDLQAQGNVKLARAFAEAAHSRTGIDIHPATEIGADFFIDHGTGDVIGETAKIGKNVMLYHGVTLGANGSIDRNNRDKLMHRHPEIGDNCTISVGVKVLGHVVVGDNVTLGPDSKLTGDTLNLGDGAKVGAGAMIGDGNTIAPGVTIGANAFIPKGIGLINSNVPSDARVIGRNSAGQLEFGTRLPGSYVDRVTARPQNGGYATQL